MLNTNLSGGGPPITRMEINCMRLTEIYGAADDAQSNNKIFRALNASTVSDERNQPTHHTKGN